MFRWHFCRHPACLPMSRWQRWRINTQHNWCTIRQWMGTASRTGWGITYGHNLSTDSSLEVVWSAAPRIRFQNESFPVSSSFPTYCDSPSLGWRDSLVSLSRSDKISGDFFIPKVTLSEYSHERKVERLTQYHCLSQLQPALLSYCPGLGLLIEQGW